MIKSVDTTDLLNICVDDQNEDTFSVAALEAGSNVGKNEIVLPACTVCGTVEILRRTWYSTKAHAGAVNGLHRYLVSQAQIHSDWTVDLGAETDDDRPLFYYTISATATTVSFGASYETGHDASWMQTLLGEAEAKLRLRRPTFLTKNDDSTLGAAIQGLFGKSSEGDDLVAALKAKRIEVFGA